MNEFSYSEIIVDNNPTISSFTQTFSFILSLKFHHKTHPRVANEGSTIDSDDLVPPSAFCQL
jgi:hypothetical protein